jgi:hypothetical protein
VIFCRIMMLLLLVQDAGHCRDGGSIFGSQPRFPADNHPPHIASSSYSASIRVVEARYKKWLCVSLHPL